MQKRLGNLTRNMPLIHRFLVFIYHILILELIPLLRRQHAPTETDEDFESFLSLQSVGRLSCSLSCQGNWDALLDALNRENIPYVSGGWTIYFPPSKGLALAFPEMKNYPQGSGVKLLKHLASPEEAVYTLNALKPAPGAAALRRRTPKAVELLRIAGALYNAGLGPKVHDLVAIDHPRFQATAFIVEHMDGPLANSTQRQNFLSRLDEVLDQNVLGVAHGDYRMSKDFSPPDCNGNLRCGPDDSGLYVDFQSFVFRNEKLGFETWAEQHADTVLFGPRRWGRGQGYLYQMIPGLGAAKRETRKRWEVMDQLFNSGGVGLKGRPVMDIGCNSGLMCYYALARGASWAYGWDRPAVADSSRQLLNLLGASRATITGTSIDGDTNFTDCMQAGGAIGPHLCNGVLFFLAVSNHIGFPSGVSDLPWQYCVYEGHSNQDVEESLSKIRSSGWTESLIVLATTLISDGDSPERVLILFGRDPAQGKLD